MNESPLKNLMIFAAILFAAVKANGQATMPDELTRGTIKEQINYLQDKTRIYENYRAVREDMFQKINRNILDTLSSDRKSINELRILTSNLRSTNDSVNIILETTRQSLAETTATKNSITVLGMEVNKTAYNSIMWTIIAVISIVLVFGFLVFKRNLMVTIRTGKELKELSDEFETYRQSTRIAREKMTMDHFNEMQRLKGK
ncbi:MAG: hypothetical protein A2X05_12220 [Bacteroidetes bacterium GWE2_41_25]|nr:MAG: hypothetical protein A2X03_14730 [Bacteroidetes bacterium GWA2_40_15]OFX98948.1 MAG: hypothetical protein A2X06_12675 [Bacteroidetes bacterium GWC2_40_22]OFY00006.1 MAG: hypothetical protein A2X05_12220 [Bacteroidetes bacterium GWE2_41_25]OFY59660.1 MAG: hypothetical protein A2X04_13310 [Bacteroidetes bacterium GWF2_41_9]HBH85443.1 hypothetical protein [Bacteroidales bacterium]